MGKFSHFKKIHILKLLQNNEIKNSKNSHVISILITSKATKTLKTFFNSRIQKLENKLLQVFLETRQKYTGKQLNCNLYKF